MCHPQVAAAPAGRARLRSRRAAQRVSQLVYLRVVPQAQPRGCLGASKKKLRAVGFKSGGKYGFLIDFLDFGANRKLRHMIADTYRYPHRDRLDERYYFAPFALGLLDKIGPWRALDRLTVEISHHG